MGQNLQKIREALIPKLRQDILAYMARQPENTYVDDFVIARDLYKEVTQYREAYRHTEPHALAQYRFAPHTFETDVHHLMIKLREEGLIKNNEQQPYSDRTYVGITQRGRESLPQDHGR